MTTIAWDGRTLAADRQRTHGDSRQPVCKLHDCGEYVYASCGDRPDGVAVARWLSAGADWDKRPTLDEGGCCGIAVRKADGAVFVVEGKTVTLCPVPPGPTATGSGKDYALAAMACGKDARGAVEIASRFDVFTGLGVDAVDVIAAERQAAE